MGAMLSIHSSYAQSNSSNRQIACGGVERWSIKILTDNNVNIVNFTPVPTTIDSLIHIITPIPTSGTLRIAGIEDQVYKIRCHITVKKFESDNDYHLILRDNFNQTLIAEVPDPLCSSSASSAFVNQFISARTFVDTNIAFGNIYNVNLPEVEVTGVSFIDIEHGQTGSAPNQLELHPVLDIHFTQPIGINEVQEALLSVSISPNPSSGKFVVNISSKKNNLSDSRLELYNPMATRLAEYKLPVNAPNSISTTVNANVPPGAYIYRITNNGIPVYHGKIIITK